MTPDRARAAIAAALPADLARKLAKAPGDIFDHVVALVVEDHCTVEQSVEALALAVQLDEATESGGITEDQGLEIMGFLALRQLGAPPG